MGEGHVVRVIDRAADADLDGPPRIDQPLLDGAAERRAVGVSIVAEIAVVGVVAVRDQIASVDTVLVLQNIANLVELRGGDAVLRIGIAGAGWAIVIGAVVLVILCLACGTVLPR